MAGIFNLFGDSTQVARNPTTFAPVGSNTNNSALKLRNVGAPGATPSKIFGPKSRGLSIRSTSELNIRSSTPQSFHVKKSDAPAEKFMLNPKDIFGKSTSPVKQKSPNKLKSPKKLFEKSTSSIFLLSPNSKSELKPEEIIFKRPKTPKLNRKRNMDYPEPEVLAPIGDIDFELFDLTNQNFLKSCGNKYFFPDEDEGFLSDTEPVPIVQEEIRSSETAEEVRLELPALTPLPDSTSDDDFN